MGSRLPLLAVICIALLLVAGASFAKDDRPKHDHDDGPLECPVCRAAYDKAMDRVCSHVRRSSFPVKMACGYLLLADGRHEKELKHCVDSAIKWRTHRGYKQRSHPGNWYPALAGAFLAEYAKHRPERPVKGALQGLVEHFTAVQEQTGGWWKWHEGAYKERLDYAVVDHGFVTVLVMSMLRTIQAQGIEVPPEVLEQGEACITRITNTRGVGYGTPRGGGRSGGDKTGGRGALLMTALAYAGDLEHPVYEICRKVLPERLPNLDQGHHVGALHGLAVTLGCHTLGPKTYRRLTDLWLDRLIEKQADDGGLYVGDDGDAGGEPKLYGSNVGSTAVLALMILLQDPDRLVPPDRERNRRDGSLPLNTSAALAKQRARDAAIARRQAAKEEREREQAARAEREERLAVEVPPWDTRLVGAVRRALEEGRRIRYRSRAFKRKAAVTGVDDEGRLKVRAGGMGTTIRPARLGYREKAEIARAAVREGMAEDHAIAAFYSLAAGDLDKGTEHLEQAGELEPVLDTLFHELGILR